MGFWFFRYDDFVVIVHDDICSMKTCVKCKKILSLDNFYWHKQNSNYYNRCKICENIRTNKWKNENKEKNLLKRFFDLIKNFFNSNKVKEESKQKEKR